MNSSRLCVLAAWLAGCGEAPAAEPGDAAAPHDVTTVDVAADVPVALPCSLGGSGRLRVSVALAPALEPRAPEVWLAARCGADLREVRLVRWDRSPSMLLDGLGPGVYEVFASSFLAAPTASARAMLDPFATASLSVTLGSEPAAIAALTAGGAGVSVDAGVAPRADAGGSADAAAAVGWSGRAYIHDATGALIVGVVEAEVVGAAEADAGGASRISVRVVARNTCVAASCPAIALGGAEVRALDGESPVGVGDGAFVAPRLAAGESTSLRSAIELGGALPDARRSVRVAVYGQVLPGAAGARQP